MYTMETNTEYVRQEMIYAEPHVSSHQQGPAHRNAGHPQLIAMKRNECYATKKPTRNEEYNYAQPIVEARDPDITVQKNQCYATGILSKERNLAQSATTRPSPRSAGGTKGSTKSNRCCSKKKLTPAHPETYSERVYAGGDCISATGDGTNEYDYIKC